MPCRVVCGSWQSNENRNNTETSLVTIRDAYCRVDSSRSTHSLVDAKAAIQQPLLWAQVHSTVPPSFVVTGLIDTDSSYVPYLPSLSYIDRRNGY